MKRNTVQFLEAKFVLAAGKAYIRDSRGRAVASVWANENGDGWVNGEPTNKAVRRTAAARRALNDTFNGLRALSLCGKAVGR